MAKNQAEKPVEKPKEPEIKMTVLNIFLPDEIINGYDLLVKNRIVANRSEGFRIAITEYLMRLLEAVERAKILKSGLNFQSNS